MPYPNLYKRAEQKRGKPMAEILLPLLNEGGTALAANELDVDQWTIGKWAHMAGLEYVCVWQRSGETITVIAAQPVETADA